MHALRSLLSLDYRPVCGKVRSLFVLLSLLAICGTGCSKFDLRENIPWKDTSDTPKIPGRITALWTHTVLEQAGKRGVRGFGGRLMFHDKDGEKPVMVEGDLVVYAFDDTNGPRSYPEKKFVFNTTDLPSHHSKSRLGHSYSFWLPWDEVGGPPRKISLVVRFTPQGSASVMSEAAHVMLPGIDPEVKQEIQQAAAKFRERQKQLQAAGNSSTTIAADVNVSEQGGVVQTSGTVNPSAHDIKVEQQPNGLEVITLDGSAGLSKLLQQPSTPTISPGAQAPNSIAPVQPPVSSGGTPPAANVAPSAQSAPGSQSQPRTPSVKASLSERAAARRPGRFARPPHRAPALAGSITAPGRANPRLPPSTELSDPTALLAPAQNAPTNPPAGSIPASLRN